MRTLDETDLEILHLLVEDARRPYSEIADRVDVSAPTVSDRIDRLVDLGVVRGFTADVDHASITGGTDVLLDLECRPGAGDRTADRLAAAESVEHVFETADERVLAVATVQQGRAKRLLAEAVDLEWLRRYRVHLLADRSWTPTVGSPDLALSCAECDNTVGADGVSSRIDGELYHFCCPTCRSTFEDRYDRFADSA
ncbi:AsnC family transcriptional regulator [Natrononativus amylolyticus]|uniref:AsnC family transcriptional regulator n=1 Tax=Natrononativus amylolyticus TaxID=2963434 RepID=UPI0020CBBD2F|nr:AsnC family transcriptional regulator [Natrononativus amylolyticus]